jgi:hypothetical protein
MLRMGHLVDRRSEKKSYSKTPVRRSVNHDTDEGPLLFSTTMVLRRKKNRPSSTQIER